MFPTCSVVPGAGVGLYVGLFYPVLAAGNGLASPLGPQTPGTGRLWGRVFPPPICNPAAGWGPSCPAQARGKIRLQNLLVESLSGKTHHTPLFQTLSALLRVQSCVPGSCCPLLPSVRVLNTHTRKKKKEENPL